MRKSGPVYQPEGMAGVSGPPVWDLSDLYASATDPKIASDLNEIQAQAEAFAKRYQGKVTNLNGGELGSAIAEYEIIQERLGRALSYAQLLFAADSTDPACGKFYQTMSERGTTINSLLLFFTLEINRIDEAALAAKLADQSLAHYASWLRDLRVFLPHQLS
ncbi:MAG: oligoendopeptidase F, partial [Acidocella sp. 21-58-7]